MNSSNSTPTQLHLKELLSYDEKSGLFFWNQSRGNKEKFSIAGTKNVHGYIGIQINKRKNLAHRLAWLYVYGSIPDCQIDHINGNRSDNRISNLRLATHKQNGENLGIRKNNTSGFRGVSFQKGKWVAQVRANKKAIYCGRFESPIEASKVAEAKRQEIFTHHRKQYESNSATRSH